MAAWRSVCWLLGRADTALPQGPAGLLWAPTPEEWKAGCEQTFAQPETTAQLREATRVSVSL